jgi:hypothetical protein
MHFTKKQTLKQTNTQTIKPQTNITERTKQTTNKKG